MADTPLTTYARSVEGLVVGLAALLVLWVVVIGTLYLTGRGPLARELALLLPNIGRLFHGLARDDRVPRRTKLIVLIGVAWLASPLDLIPEFIPVVGPLDDAIVAALILRHVVRTAGQEVVVDHWHGSPATLRRLLAITRSTASP